jgi:hypothetical protein
MFPLSVAFDVLSLTIIRPIRAKYEEGRRLVHQPMFSLDRDSHQDAESPGSSEFTMKHDDPITILDRHLPSLSSGPLDDIVCAERKVPKYVESRLTPEIYSNMIDQFSNKEHLFPTIVLIDHFAKSIPLITRLLRELFLSLLVKVIVHERWDIRQSALATVSFFCIADVEAFTVEDLQIIALCHLDNIRMGNCRIRFLP